MGAVSKFQWYLTRHFHFLGSKHARPTLIKCFVPVCAKWLCSCSSSSLGVCVSVSTIVSATTYTVGSNMSVNLHKKQRWVREAVQPTCRDVTFSLNESVMKDIQSTLLVWSSGLSYIKWDIYWKKKVIRAYKSLYIFLKLIKTMIHK